MTSLRRCSLLAPLLLALTSCSGSGTRNALPQAAAPTLAAPQATARRALTLAPDAVSTSPSPGVTCGAAVSALPGAAVSALPGTCGTPAPTLETSVAAKPPAPPANGAPRKTCTPGHPGIATCTASVQGTTSRLYRYGLRPGDLADAYKVPQTANATTIAIVDAYDDPTAEHDLAVYRAQFGLPPCTQENHCFRKIGAGTDPDRLPRPDAGWGTEVALDLDMVSATCPGCAIVLVEAQSADLSDLASAMSAAAKSGARIISASFYTEDSAYAQQFAAAFSPPGIPVVTISGDNGYGASFPASLPNAIAVGGTSLRPASNARGWIETTWSGAGSGCANYSRKPRWQDDALCATRTIADLSVVADPDYGVAIYTTTTTATPGWNVAGGTSAGAPIVAGMIARAGNAAQLTTAEHIYATRSALFDITSGDNGVCANALCDASIGFDGPTGLGSPNGLGAL